MSSRLPLTLSRALPVFTFIGLVTLSLGCGGGGSGGGTGGGGGGGGGGGLGPSGLTCTTPAACSSVPAGTIGVLCNVNNGPNTPVIPSDFDHALTSLNAIRTARGLPAFVRTAALDAFAQGASTQLMADNIPHAFFAANFAGNPAFIGGGAENQGSPTGWPANTTTSQITDIINCFMSEETAGAGAVKGHFESIVCPCYLRIGVGLVKNGAGALFLSIEFSQ